MNLSNVVGQTLDGKYQIERELGRGGMGTVYLATHLGTERPVAVKVIAPEYMERPEFVERFRREARAAGRLRHPNVVNVTDFGFASTSGGRAAYLVMEYLDGCTLGEILEEEQNLPVGWTLDILEQVCSAVQAAHEQGIIHRDLKPDNIWLEPNQRGGYTVKVLDFGIAKLEQPHAGEIDSEAIDISSAPDRTRFVSSRQTLADQAGATAFHDGVSSTLTMQQATLVQSADAAEARTAIMPIAPLVADPDTVGTRLVSDGEPSTDTVPSTIAADLTRVGAVIGTPLYMSPEQCRGEKLDPRSDIYSLGVIAYQMLAGRTPFEGDHTFVMEAHKAFPPPPLHAKKVRKKLKRVIATALAKDPRDRPQTAEAFASVLRSRSEGILGLLRRAGMIYTEHMPKFLILSAFFYIPMIILTGTLMTLTIVRAADAIPSTISNLLLGLNGILLWIFGTFSAYLIVGTITWIVAQNLAVPLRPIRLRPALKEAKRKWKTFAGTGFMTALLPIPVSLAVFIPVFSVLFVILGLVFGFGPAAIASAVVGAFAASVAFFVTNVLMMPIAAVVMMENRRGWQAIKRAQGLVRRSLATAIAAFLIMFMIPVAAAGVISFVVNTTAQAVGQGGERVQVPDQNQPPAAAPSETPAESEEDEKDVIFGIGRSHAVSIKREEKDMPTRVKDAALETLSQLLLLPLQIVATSFTAIIMALLYIKTRQAGGESLQDLLTRFEESEQPRKKWQERVRQRLMQSGRITSRPSNETSNP